MVSQLPPLVEAELIYPESDGKPMADNTRQFRWIVVIQQNLDWLFAKDEQVFVAGDLLWYPVEGDNKTVQAPDVMVAFGRPRGDRGSYKQWQEENVPPQVVFEILSPSNSQTEMNKKLVFYNRFGVEEYYLYDPDRNDLSGWLREEANLNVIDPIANWVSPRLGIRFEWSSTELQLYHPNGDRFLSYSEIVDRAVEVLAQLTNVSAQLTDVSAQLDESEQRAAKLAAKLRELGIDPNQL